MTDHPTEGTGGKLKLQSQEGTIFEVSRQVSFMSQLCKNMAEGGCCRVHFFTSFPLLLAGVVVVVVVVGGC